ncbi:serine protease easter-like isoform X1 [Diorhabda carinulata]|uniref:serine protease easter-like isoform X1 n=1 Tax=Diorhabda carinulata TaxID=1163345 RepID=UPI0025A31107|nr:serine protease easter-like isoform X1 [Diorhabda carinulata]
MFAHAVLFVCLAAALVSICQSGSISPSRSPCPEFFTYESSNNRGYWTASLTLRSDYDLHGIWIRLIFDKDVKDLTIDSQFDIKIDSADRRTIKVQGPSMNLKVGESKILNMNVTYEGSEIPSLIEYRLNARTICPEVYDRNVDVFNGDAKSEYFLPSLQTKKQIIQQKYECGVPYTSNKHPWQAAVYLRINREEVYTCDAILIDPMFVITAAHCVTLKNGSKTVPRSIVTIRFGEDGSDENASKSFVSNIIVHSDYIPGSLMDDVAVLRLVDPVDITKKFRPICLGINSKSEKIVLSGYVLDKEGRVEKVIDSDVSRVDQNDCLISSPNLVDVLTYDTYCVAYNPGDQNCIGNSGSALVSKENGKTTLQGLVSLSARLQNQFECNDKTNIIITNINRYLHFIANIIYH